jgi:hypothetical protein
MKQLGWSRFPTSVIIVRLKPLNWPRPASLGSYNATLVLTDIAAAPSGVVSAVEVLLLVRVEPQATLLIIPAEVPPTKAPFVPRNKPCHTPIKPVKSFKGRFA